MARSFAGGLDFGRSSWTSGTGAISESSQFVAQDPNDEVTYLVWAYLHSTAIADFTFLQLLGFDQGVNGLAFHHLNGGKVKRFSMEAGAATGDGKTSISANNTLVASAFNFVAGVDTNLRGTDASVEQKLYKGNLTSAATETGYFNQIDAANYRDLTLQKMIMGVNSGLAKDWAGDIYYAQRIPIALSQDQIQRCQYNLNYALELGLKHGGNFYLPGMDGAVEIVDLVSGNNMRTFGPVGLQDTIWPVKQFQYPIQYPTIALPPRPTFLGHFGTDPAAGVATISGMRFSGKDFVLNVCSYASGSSITDITIDGVSVSTALFDADASSAVIMSPYEFTGVSAGTHDVVITHSGSTVFRIGISAWEIPTGWTRRTSYDDDSGTDPLDLSLNTSAGEAVLAFANINNDSTYTIGDATAVGLTIIDDSETDPGSGDNRYDISAHNLNVDGGSPETFTLDTNATKAFQSGYILVYAPPSDGVTGTGAITFGALTLAGVAEDAQTGTGDIQIPALAIAGTATRKITGTGNISLPAQLLAGTAMREITGSGAITLGAATIAGSGAREIAGSGAVTFGAVTVAGTGLREITGTGDIQIPAMIVAGTSEREITGSGAITFGPLTIQGASQEIHTASGDIGLPSFALAGVSEREVTGSGALTFPTLDVSGTSERVVAGSGALTFGALTVLGAAVRELTATGDIQIPALTTAGAGKRTITGTGDISLPVWAASGVTQRTVNGSGNIVFGSVYLIGNAPDVATSKAYTPGRGVVGAGRSRLFLDEDGE